MTKLTKEEIQSLTVPEGKREHLVFDEDLPGFGIRLRPGGARSWVVQYRTKDRISRRITIGPTRLFSPAAARTEAKRLLAMVRLGGDPATEKRTAPLEQRITRKALAFLQRGIKPACYLYRHYHPNGDLLYVGISLQPIQRNERHAKAASWRHLICRILIEPFETRELALAAEEAAIRNEFPKHNSTHNGNRHPIQELHHFSRVPL